MLVHRNTRGSVSAGWTLVARLNRIFSKLGAELISSHLFWEVSVEGYGEERIQLLWG